MKKRNLVMFSVLAIVVLGIGAVSAFGNGKMIGLDDEEKEEMEAFHNSLNSAIESGDFDTWKSLKESRLTEEHFEEVQARWAEREEHRLEMQKAFENGEMPRGQGRGMHGGMIGFQGEGNFGECPFADSE